MEIRRLMTPRDDRKPVYLDTQGLRVGRSGGVLQVKERDRTTGDPFDGHLSNERHGEHSSHDPSGQSLCEAEIPLCYFSQGGWFYGITTGLCTKNVFLRQRQFALAEQPWFRLSLAQQLTSGKIRNQRTFLQRNHIEPPGLVLAEMKRMAERADRSESMEELLGLEGNAARLYFGEFPGLIKVDSGDGDLSDGGFTFDFEGRNAVHHVTL